MAEVVATDAIAVPRGRQLPLQQFRRRLKLIPNPKGAYNGTEKITICPWGCLHWGSAYIRNYTVYAVTGRANYMLCSGIHNERAPTVEACTGAV